MTAVNRGKMLKLGRGFYCGLIDTIPNRPAVFCINGFYLAMRAEYMTADAAVHYFVVEWEESVMSWSEFRKKVIGSTNPCTAHPESLRFLMSTQWEDLGLSGPLDMMRNGVHASASAFEALVERSIWLGQSLETDLYFGKNLVASGVPAHLLEEWTTNPIVRNKYLFDIMENKGSAQCLHIAKELHMDTCLSGDVAASSEVGNNVRPVVLPDEMTGMTRGRSTPSAKLVESNFTQKTLLTTGSLHQAHRLPSLSPIVRPEKLLPRSASLMANRIGNEGTGKRWQEKSDHREVPQGSYYSSSALQSLSPPGKFKEQHKLVLTELSHQRRIAPSDSGMSVRHDGRSVRRGQNKTSPSAPSPANQVFSI